MKFRKQISRRLPHFILLKALILGATVAPLSAAAQDAAPTAPQAQSQAQPKPESVFKQEHKAEKAEEGERKYSDPINQIQDQVGARVIVLYLDDVEPVAEQILKYYRSIEQKHLIPESEKEFGYVGQHFILALHKEVLPTGVEIGRAHV